MFRWSVKCAFSDSGKQFRGRCYLHLLMVFQLFHIMTSCRLAAGGALVLSTVWLDCYFSLGSNTISPSTLGSTFYVFFYVLDFVYFLVLPSTVSQERSQPIITPIRDFFSWTFVSQPKMQGNDSATNICLGFWGFLNTHLGSKFPNRKKRALKPYMMTSFFFQKPYWVSLIHKYRGLYYPVYVLIFPSWHPSGGVNFYFGLCLHFLGVFAFMGGFRKTSEL